MRVAPESPAGTDVRALLLEHLAEMRATSPPESVHALDAAGLLVPSITFLAARDDAGTLLGCGALAELEPPVHEPGGGRVGAGDALARTGGLTGGLTGGHGELKSMRTARAARGRGVAGAVLARLLALAAQRRYTRVSLETGSQEFFAPARRLYARHGFVECGPFAGYASDPHSVFMTLPLPRAGGAAVGGARVGDGA